ncbi:MAG: Asp-tRNA(Asn)/Glu-tRNA(Gln) amidotransferase subunit GatB [Candidatus Omnitrophica bacterium]|nr:Asp-tRNA(Asn)/Glu-tRNA(Gln) amidotransferase subunit GatB [Candidatus Omnitrophota bacterium]
MSLEKYEPVIGLEVHVQLQTKSKIFCSCSTKFGAEANTQTCPICLGLPGSLPVLNEQALYYGIKAGIALNCHIAERLKFDRKNYFYPDLPKAYQISQFDMPVAYRGWLMIETKDGNKKIGITRAHLEEDAGKLIHEGIKDASVVDYNRCGTPLLEIVSEPDLRTPEDAYEYLTTLKAILEYLEVSDCNMDEGSLRCDANVSIRLRGAEKFGTKAEIKNLNSFKAVAKSIQYEIERQAEVLESGERVIQETRLWNDEKGQTISMRSKEEAHDYRYFPEPDLVPFTISRQRVEEIRKTLPELPQAREERFLRDYKLSNYDAHVLVSDKKHADYFEQAIRAGADPKKVSNWLTSELFGLLNTRKETLDTCKVSAKALSGLIQLIDKQVISGKIAKEVLPIMVETGKDPETIVKEKGLVQVTDTKFLEDIAKKIIEVNPKSVADFKSGKTAAIGFLVGQMMKETKGKANPALANQILEQQLKKS